MTVDKAVVKMRKDTSSYGNVSLAPYKKRFSDFNLPNVNFRFQTKSYTLINEN